MTLDDEPCERSIESEETFVLSVCAVFIRITNLCDVGACWDVKFSLIQGGNTR